VRAWPANASRRASQNGAPDCAKPPRMAATCRSSRLAQLATATPTARPALGQGAPHAVRARRDRLHAPAGAAGAGGAVRLDHHVAEVAGVAAAAVVEAAVEDQAAA